MNIWLINPYGQIPSEGWRDYRFTLLGKALVKRGHRATWWTANFSHTFKKFRLGTWANVSVSEGFDIRLVPTTAYRKNIGFGRILFESVYSWRVYRRAIKSPPPECIVAMESSQIVGFMAVRLGRKLGVPVILDVFDLWPELFVLALPRSLRPYEKLIFAPLYRLRRNNLTHASALVSLAKDYLRHSVAIREASGAGVVPAITIYNGIELEEPHVFRPGADAGLDKKAGDVWVVYTGTLGDNYDIETMLLASRILQARGSRIKLLIAGMGSQLALVSDFIEKHPSGNVEYLGKSLTPGDLLKLYRASDIALSPYKAESNVAMPNKAYDYMAAGLPIVNSLRGELEELLRDLRIGVQYTAADPVSLSNVLESLARDKDLRLSMARNSFEAARQFDTKVLYQEYSEFIEQVATTRAGDAASPTYLRDEIVEEKETKGGIHVRPMDASDLAEVVDMHLSGFSGFFLTFLGRDFLARLYECICRDPGGLVLIACMGNARVGFVAGVTQQEGFYRRLIKKELFAFAAAAAGAFFRRPSIAPRLLRALRRPAQAGESAAPACLMSIAVRPELPQKGTGKALVGAFSAELRKRGIKSYCLTTDRDGNDDVNGFYRNQGFQFVRSFTTPEGRPMNEYVMKLAEPC